LTIDVTEQKAAQEEIKFLLRELIHRSKNQFAVLNSIAKDVYRQAGSEEDFAHQFQLRMISLAKSQDLAVQGSIQRVELASLMLSQAEIFGAGPRIDISGPPVEADETAAQYLSIAFYELITNSIKYGALATENKKIHFSWSLADDQDSIEIAWQEELDGPRQVWPLESADSGFGMKVLRFLAARAIAGTSDLSIGDDRLVWKLIAPLTPHFQR
jgi:two-component sensor histidine kinase